MKPGPKPSSGKTMTHAERQARYRAKQAERAPTLRYRTPADRRSRVQRWLDAVSELQELQGDYQGWLDVLPKSRGDGPRGAALGGFCALDLSERKSIGPP